MSKGNLAIYQNEDGSISIDAVLEMDTIWLTQSQMSKLFESSIKNISEHIMNIIEEGELLEQATIRNFRIVQTEGKRQVTRDVIHYNLDMIISVGYRVKSKTATKFRIWATGVLKQFIADGYALNEKVFAENRKRLESLRTAISMLDRNIQNEQQLDHIQSLSKLLSDYAVGLNLLNDYDHNNLDSQGHTIKIHGPKVTYEELVSIIEQMKTDTQSDIFGVQKDNSFESSINQIYQTFDGIDCYESIEEKAAMLLYLIVKNHSFIDGNKRIAASCFLYFLNKNGLLYDKDNQKTISNEALFALTLLIANSNPDEMQIINQIIISILNCYT